MDFHRHRERRSPLRWQTPVVAAAITVCVVALLVQACSDSLPSAPTDPHPQIAADVIPNPNPNCTGVSYTMITTEDDSVMAQYGIPAETDTVNICENWVGNDYTMQAVVAGSSENLPTGRDTIQAVNYQSGTVTGAGANGSTVATQSVGQTSFDMMNADAALRQASYDSPYYAITSANEGGACVPPPGQRCPLVATRDPNATAFTGHGLTRQGVRALVNGASEIALSPEGHRRFQHVSGKVTTVWTVDEDTQLLIGEDVITPTGRLQATHFWKQVGPRYVRDHTDITDVDVVNGRSVPSHAVITFVNVHLPMILPTPAVAP